MTSSIDATSRLCAATSMSVARAKCSSSIAPPAGRKMTSTSTGPSYALWHSHLLRRLLRSHPRRGKCPERALGVVLADEEVDVVVRRGPAARPDREPAAEHELDLGLAQRGRRVLHRRDERVEGLPGCRRHARAYPVSPFSERDERVQGLRDDSDPRRRGGRHPCRRGVTRPHRARVRRRRRGDGSRASRRRPDDPRPARAGASSPTPAAACSLRMPPLEPRPSPPLRGGEVRAHRRGRRRPIATT